MFKRATTNWKGVTYSIAVPYFKKNTIQVSDVTADLFKPRNIPHRRLEISNSDACGSRPNYANLLRNAPGVFRYETSGTTLAIDAPVFPMFTCDGSGCASAAALQRVRRISNGMQRNAEGAPKYFQSSTEYLRNRQKLAEQHNYHYIQSGDATAQPGSTASQENQYRPRGPASCPKYKIAAELQNHRFSYTWVDGTTKEITFPDGWYTLAVFQNALEQKLVEAGDYYRNESTGTNYFLFKFTAHPDANRISLTIVDPATFVDIATNQGESPEEGADQVPTILFTGSSLGLLGLGFTQSSYVSAGIYISERFGGLAQTYRRTHFHPSNPQYAVSGAVQSSDRTLRLQYNTMNRTAASYAAPYGQGNATAMAYGVMRDKRVEKDKHNQWPYSTPKLQNGVWKCVRDCKMRF